MGVEVATVPRGGRRLLEPRDRVIETAEFDQVRPDVVVRIPEPGVDGDRALAFLDRVVVSAHEAERPTVKRVRLAGRRESNRALVRVRGPFELPRALEDVGGLEGTARRILARLPHGVEGARVERTSRECLGHEVPEVLVVVARHTAFPRVGEQVLDRKEPPEIDRDPLALLAGSRDHRGRGLVEGHVERLASVADELHEGEVVDTAAAGDQEPRVRHSGQELPRRRRIKDENAVEGFLRRGGEDAHRIEPRGVQSVLGLGPPLLVGFDDDEAFRADDLRQEGGCVSTAAALEEDAEVRGGLEEVQGGDEAPGGRHGRRIRGFVERERHVRIRERAERLRQERLLPYAEERTFEFPAAQKAEPFQLGEKVLPSPHSACAPGMLIRESAKRFHNLETSQSSRKIIAVCPTNPVWSFQSRSSARMTAAARASVLRIWYGYGETLVTYTKTDRGVRRVMSMKRGSRVVSKKRQTTWWTAAVAILALGVLMPAGALASPPPPSPVTISGVRVDSNSLSGTEATLRWATSPTSACDTFAYKYWMATTWTTIALACKVHTVSIGGLLPHRIYDFTITSTAKKYISGTYSSSFSPTDVSLSKAYEGDQFDVGAQQPNCGPVYVHTTRAAEMPGDIEFDPAATSNANSYQAFDVDMKYYGQGQSGCWSWDFVTKRTSINIYVIDRTSQVMNWITSAVDPIPKVASSGTSGTIAWSINFGTQIYQGTPIGVSLSYVPSSGISVTPTWHNDDYGGGIKRVAELVVDWDGHLQTSLDVVWPMHVIDSLAQYRRYDQVEILVSFGVTFDFHSNTFGWAGHDWYFPFDFYLGRGWDNNGANNLDQYTDVQMGHSSGVT